MKCSVRPQASSFPPPAEVDEEVVQGHAAQLQAELLGVHVRRAGARRAAGVLAVRRACLQLCAIHHEFTTTPT